MSSKQLRDYLSKIPPGMREKIAATMEPNVADANAKEAGEAFALASDAILNLGVIAFANAANENEAENVKRSTAFATVTMKVCEQIVMRMIPTGPREAIHDMLNRGIKAELDTFDEVIANLLPKGVKVRADVLAGVAKGGQDLATEALLDETPAPEGASMADDVGKL